MTFNLWTFLFEALNFLVLVFILHRVLYRPLRDAIDRRRQDEARARTDAEKARAETADMRRRLEENEAHLEEERQDMLRRAAAEVETVRRKLLAEADETARRRRQEAEAALQRERTEALDALRGDLTHLAVDFAERLLRESCDASLHRQLALHLAESLEAVPEPERERLHREWQPQDGVVIEAAAELNGTTRERLGTAVGGLLGSKVRPEFVVRPELLAGVRLRVGGRVWDATLGSRLAEARGGRT
jgi:F-type H+-transporting ATPase subunit b